MLKPFQASASLFAPRPCDRRELPATCSGL